MHKMSSGATGSLAKVEIFADLEAMSRAAARLFARACAESKSSKREFTVALSGGSTPRSLYLLLGSGYYMRALDWRRVHIFWADERCVPPDHEQSNFKLASDTFLSRVAIPPENVHRIKGEEPAEQAASRYEDALRTFFGASVMPAFDLILLGMGEDGHTASLFPGSPALAEKKRVAVAAVAKQPPQVNRVTLTLPILNNGHRIVFLVSGSAKARILQEILTGTETKRNYPAGLVESANGELTWFIDKAAAAFLPSSLS
jgi:6-phosphogluconolactonase